MRTNWVNEKKLEIDVSFNKVNPWSQLSTVQNVSISKTNEIMEGMLHNFSVNH